MNNGFHNPHNQLVSSKTGIIIGIPTLGRPVPMEWAMAFKSMSPPINYNMLHSLVFNQPIDKARNLIAKEAVKNDSRYLFFLGDDVVCPPHTLKQLVFRMEQDSQLGVVGGIYCSKCDPAAPLVFRDNGIGSYWDWKIGEFFEVTGIGMDACLIRTDVFRELPEPWFQTKSEDKFLDAVNTAEMWTEDLYFCKQVLEHTKYKIYADASVICDHWDVYTKRVYNIPPNSLPFRTPAIEQGKKKVLDVGAGGFRRNFGDDCEVVTCDIRDETKPDYRCDVRVLPFASGEFDIVFSSHVLEHFNRSEWTSVLAEWCRVLKDDGELQFNLPNIQWAAKRIHEDQVLDEDVLNVLYGAQTNPYDFHYNGLTPERVCDALPYWDLLSIENIHFNMLLRFKRRMATDGNAKQNNPDSIAVTAESGI